MASGMGWTKACRKCGKERQYHWFRTKQATKPGQLPICKICEQEKEDAITNGK